MLRPGEPGMVRQSSIVSILLFEVATVLNNSRDRPQAISSGMLRRPPHNLNRQAEDATILLIREVLQSGIELSEVLLPSSPTCLRTLMKALIGIRRRTRPYEGLGGQPLKAIPRHQLHRHSQSRLQVQNCRSGQCSCQSYSRCVDRRLGV